MKSNLGAGIKSKKVFTGLKAPSILSRLEAEKLRKQAVANKASFEERLVAAEKRLGIGVISSQTLQLFVNRNFGKGSFERAERHLIHNANFPKIPPYSREHLIQIIDWLKKTNGKK